MSVDVPERLVELAREYELMASFYEERGSVDAQAGRTALGCTAVAIALREVANAFEGEREAA
jgi:hypothetical protein